jgi:hypothetical protein
MPNITTLLDSNVSLQCECIDRLYLNGYIPDLQRAPQAEYFLSVHRGQPVASAALFGQMTKAFVSKVEKFAADHKIPIVEFEKGQKKERIAQPYFEKAAARRKHGVVMIGVAQERCKSFRNHVTKNGRGRRTLTFNRQSVCVKHFYFYILDESFGPSFIKFCSYAPFTLRVWLNGHEWAKRQLRREGIRYESLDNGFLAVDDPKRLQEICDSLSATHIEAYFRHWLAHLPHPFTAADRKAGYRYRLSILQLEVSHTQVFQRPLHGREFFEEVIRENLDLGRPDRVSLVFGRRVTRRTPGRFRTRVITDGVDPNLHIDYKHCRIKQYFKLGRALRTETTINDTYDFGVRRGLSSLDYLRQIGRNINHRLLHLERTVQDCSLGRHLFEKTMLPTRHEDQRAPGLRFGDPRVMALMGALAAFTFVADGITNKKLRPRVAALMDTSLAEYSAARMSYDLRRLRLKGIVRRIDGQNRYALTTTGRRLALFYAKAYARIFKPGLQSMHPDAVLPESRLQPLARSWQALDRVIENLVQSAKLCA